MKIFMSKDQTSRVKKSYRAKDMAVSAMACPTCQLKFEEAVEVCPRCGFSGSLAVQKFPFSAPPLTAIIDPAEFVSIEAQDVMTAQLAQLAKIFPQIRVSFCLLPTGLDCDLREFGFWFLNASPLSEENGEAERPWTILLVLDAERRRISVSSGYAIEPFLSDEKLLALFRKERSVLYGLDFSRIFPRLIRGLDEILWEGAQRAMNYKRKNKKQ